MERAAWNARYAGTELVWSIEPNRFVAEALAGPAPAGGRAVDVAAGEGRNAIWLAEQGWQATALDYAEVALAKAAELAAERGVALRTEVADATAWEPAPGSYELVLIAYLQLPVEQYRMVLERAARAVAAGGRLFIVGHDRSNLDGGWGGPKDPAVLRTPDEVAAVLRELGLTVRRAETVTRTVTTDEGERVAVDHVVDAGR